MVATSNSRRIAILVIGDIIACIFSLILTLAFRYGAIPTERLLAGHLPSFSILFIIFIMVFFSAGMYDKQTVFFRNDIQGLLTRAQIVNAIIGISFFYFAPVVITPKVNLFIFFVISTAILLLWRVIMFPVFSLSRRQSVILVGQSADLNEIFEEVNNNTRYGMFFKARIIPGDSVKDTVNKIDQSVRLHRPCLIVADLHDRIVEESMPFLYTMVFEGIRIVDASRLYEAIFDRIPISLVGERWLVENSSTALGNRRLYDGLKRLIDIVVSFVGGMISLAVYPFVFAAIKLEDGGDVFIKQERVGMNGKIIRIFKFRSMSGNDNGRYGNNGMTQLTVTKVGRFLRRSRIDELPQFWNVFKGDLSLVGPRPELPKLVSVYTSDIPYYNVRHLVKPGLSGWAQIYHEGHPHHAVTTEDTRDKLSYDLYYIKNRSLSLDIKIIFRTMQILMKQVGR